VQLGCSWARHARVHTQLTGLCSVLRMHRVLPDQPGTSCALPLLQLPTCGSPGGRTYTGASGTLSKLASKLY